MVQVVLQLVGAVALLLWGAHMLTTGVVRACGDWLQTWLGTRLERRSHAFGGGLLLTILFQSSTATALMMSAFAARGLLATGTGLAVMLGANVGTALVTQALSFDVSLAAPFLLVVGVGLFRHGRARAKQWGRALLGLGIMLGALHALSLGMTPIVAAVDHHPAWNAWLSVQRTTDWQGIEVALALAAVAAVAAWVCHSSMAAVLAAAALAGAHLITPEGAVALVLGANVGGALPPLLDAHGPARAVPLGNALTRLAGVAVVGVPLMWAGRAWGGLDPRWTVDCHLAFNVVVAVLAMPFNGRLGAWMDRLYPAPETAASLARPRFLRENLEPADIAPAARHEMERMAELAGDLLAHLNPDATAIDKGARARLEQAVDGLGAVLRQAAARADDDDADPVTRATLAVFQNATVHLGLLCAEACDHMDERDRARSGGWTIAPEDRVAYGHLLSILQESWHLGLDAVLNADEDAARELFRRKTVMRVAQEEAERAHVARAARRTGGTLVDAVHSGLVLRALRDVRRMHAHIVAWSYPTMDRVEAHPTHDDPPVPSV